MPTSRMSTPAVVQPLPRRGGIVDAAEEDEVGPGLVRLVADRFEGRGDPVSLIDDLIDHPQHRRGMPQRRRAAACVSELRW